MRHEPQWLGTWDVGRVQVLSLLCSHIEVVVEAGRGDTKRLCDLVAVEVERVRRHDARLHVCKEGSDGFRDGLLADVEVLPVVLHRLDS